MQQDSNTPRAVMLSIAEIAARDGVSKAGVSRRVKNLAEKHDLTVERDGRGRVSRVNVAQYDHLRSRYGDPSKAQASKPAPDPLSPDLPLVNETYDEALRQKTWTEAERARLKLEEERGALVRTAEVADAASGSGEEIARMIYRIVNYADEHAAIAAKDGANGLRAAYKAFARQFCTDVADAMSRRAAMARDGGKPAEEIALALDDSPRPAPVSV